MKNRLFLATGILGLGAIILTLLLTLISPRPVGPMPPGFITPVLAFEFAESPSEIYQLFEPAGSAAAMDRVNRLDFLYMALYGSMLFTFALACARQTGRPIFYLAAGLSVFIVVADVLENIQLLGLTRQIALGNELDSLLANLRLYTWLKWAGLAIYFLLLIPYFLQTSGWSRLGSAFALLPFVLGGLAFFNRGLLNELFALSVGLMFLFITFYSLRRSPEPVAAVA